MLTAGASGRAMMNSDELAHVYQVCAGAAGFSLSWGVQLASVVPALHTLQKELAAMREEQRELLQRSSQHSVHATKEV